MTDQLGETPPEEPYAFGVGYRTVELTVRYRLRIPQDWPLMCLDVDKTLTVPPMSVMTGMVAPDGGPGTARFEPATDVDFLTYQYWFRENPGPPSTADLSELEACRQALAVQVARAGNAEAEVEKLRARVGCHPGGADIHLLSIDDGRVAVTWPAGRGPTTVAPEVVEDWAEALNRKTDQLAVLAVLPEELRQQQLRQELAEREATDLRAELKRVRRLLLTALDCWSVEAEMGPHEPGRQRARDQIAQLRERGGLT